MELDGLSARKARVAALDALGRLGLSERASCYPDQMSGSERERVAIARAMAGERRLVLADEPSGALDSGNAGAVMRLLHDARTNAGMAAMVGTHDAQLASWADRVLLRDGRVSGQAAPAAGPNATTTNPAATCLVKMANATAPLASMLAPRDSQPQRAEAAVMRAPRTAKEPTYSRAYSALGVTLSHFLSHGT